MGGLYSHTTRATGTVLTAAIYNADHQNHIDNQTPQMTDDYSSNATQMQSVVDPGGVGTEVLATSLAGEIERLRFIIKTMHGGAQWYPGQLLLGSSVANVIGTFALSGDISPAQITANQNDYAPTGAGTNTVWRLNSDASRNITGIGGGTDGRVLVLINIGSFNIVLTDADVGSSITNRFSFGANVILYPGATIVLVYDSTTQRWRVLENPWQTSLPVRRLNVQTFTASGTYTPTAGMLYCLARIVGPGAGGGGVGSGVRNAGSGGGAGGYCEKLISAATIGASQIVTIGTGGAAATNGSADSTFGAILTAGKGLAGAVGSSDVCVSGGGGGSASGGDVNVPGEQGGTGITPNGANTSASIGGKGGSSTLGQGGQIVAANGSIVNGNNGTGKGAGGGGACNPNQVGTGSGGTGTDGWCEVIEFLS